MHKVPSQNKTFMESKTFSFDKIPQLAGRDVDYQLKPEKFKDFIAFMPDEKGIEQAIHARKNRKVDRTLLYNVLSRQYAEVGLSPKQKLHLEKIKDENTFTVTTAHQPVLFTGPLYYLMKMFSVIRLADDLTKKYPHHHFVPVFINGAEDHDFEEIQSTSLFQKKIVWETEQKGPVGRFTLQGLHEAFQQFSDILGESPKAKDIKLLIKNALDNSSDYNGFTFQLIHGLTSAYGLLYMNMDQPLCKQTFLPYFEKELFEQKSESLISETQEKLLALGYKPQAFARKINLFYFTEQGTRNRIIYEDGVYKVLDTQIIWSENELKKVLHQNPENFSPNVVTRPLYQSAILPDVVFVGGGGEIAYWMERLSQFQYFDLFFPVLIRRNSAFIIPTGVGKTMHKLGMEIESFFPDEDKIIHDYIQNTSDNHSYFSQEQKVLTDSWIRLTEQVVTYDITLKGYMEAEKVKLSKMVDHVEQKVIRVLKQQEDQKIQQIKNVKHKLFPNNGLQERIENMFQYYITENVDIADLLYQTMNPLEKEFKVLFL